MGTDRSGGRGATRSRHARSALIASGVLAAAVALVLAGALIGRALTAPPVPAAPTGVRTANPRAGRTLVVAPDGDDRAVGTAAAPLRTLKAAEKAARTGDTVLVRGGTYDERVDFTRSGTATSPITFSAWRGEAVVLSRGFRVSGDHNVIRGFTVAPGETGATVFEAEKSQVDFSWDSCGQIAVTGDDNVLEHIAAHDEQHRAPRYIPSLNLFDGSRNVVRDIDFHDVTAVSFGADRPGKGRDNTISGGTIHHTTGSLVGISADRATLEGLDLHDPGQLDKGPDDGNAADGVDIDGAGVTIRGCRIHRVFAMTPTQHSDAIQWWNTADDLLLEGDVIGSSERGGDLGLADQGHIEWQSDTPGKTSQRVVIRNSLFLGTDGAYVLNGSPEQTRRGQADDWRIVGNTVAGPQAIRGDLTRNTRGWVIADNVFAASTDFSGPAGGATIDHNCYLGCDPGKGEGAHSFRAEETAFLTPAAPSAWSGPDAWRPALSSPLVGAGMPLPELARDFTGARRPAAPTIGALEPRR